MPLAVRGHLRRSEATLEKWRPSLLTDSQPHCPSSFIRGRAPIWLELFTSINKVIFSSKNLHSIFESYNQFNSPPAHNEYVCPVDLVLKPTSTSDHSLDVIPVNEHFESFESTANTVWYESFTPQYNSQRNPAIRTPGLPSSSPIQSSDAGPPLGIPIYEEFSESTYSKTGGPSAPAAISDPMEISQSWPHRNNSTSSDSNTVHAVNSSQVPASLDGDKSLGVPLKPTLNSRQSLRKLIQCTQAPCDKAFRRRCDLNKHLRTHDREFKCDIQGCTHNRGFALRKDLQRHIGTVHNKETLVCEYCGETFSRIFTAMSELSANRLFWTLDENSRKPGIVPRQLKQPEAAEEARVDLTTLCLARRPRQK
ncbi:hypothetical protein BJ875DRAFT_442964 [Amylocarpus encephaloides]|uniref:C2H2-type domain-containing protein n=1 Tax=Amylocarpus encephaloides TaxID=45428 RepID=A0A9P7YGJ5_9HELO|nr:hypothetical protein BJ875DRAFT_442964 [Amylocarpus encephaloides]